MRKRSKPRSSDPRPHSGPARLQHRYFDQADGEQGSPKARFWILVFTLLLVFATGGGARPDLSSLIVLRPASAVILGYALWELKSAECSRHRFLLLMALAISGLLIVHLIPLPPAIWSLLSGRDVVVQIDAAAGLGEVWRPISLVPSATWNAFFALLPPLAVLCLSVQLDARERWWIAVLLIAIGLFSALLAVAQLAGPPQSFLYPYRKTNLGSAVGLFANRNHQAVFLSSLFPLLAVYASAARRSKTDPVVRSAVSLLIGLFLIALILVTGSRMGVITLAIGLVSWMTLYTVPTSSRHVTAGQWRTILWLTGAVLGVLTVAAIWLGRATSFDRLLNTTTSEYGRGEAWLPMWSAALSYFPVGSGIGSFADAYKIHEPRDRLTTSVFLHAHNDWLEIFFTGGLPVLVLVGAAMGGFAIAAARWWRVRSAPNDDTVLLGGASLWMTIIFAVASSADYPLRVPSLTCLLMVLAVWASSLPNRVRGDDAP